MQIINVKLLINETVHHPHEITVCVFTHVKVVFLILGILNSGIKLWKELYMHTLYGYKHCLCSQVWCREIINNFAKKKKHKKN
jgi:hypothetical protein